MCIHIYGLVAPRFWLNAVLNARPQYHSCSLSYNYPPPPPAPLACTVLAQRVNPIGGVRMILEVSR